MKGLLLGIIIGIALVIAVAWHYGNQNTHANLVKQDLQKAAADTRDYVQEKLGASNLTADDIRDELSRTGAVIRRKAQEVGATVSDAATDARIIATIKSKLIADQSLSSLNIAVSTTDGLVTLSGKAPSPENIRQAIQIALDTDGVQKVISTVQLERFKK